MERIGLISDTHNNPHPHVPRVFRDVDRIFHAGDICRADVLRELHGIAPVTAVWGNNDGSTLRQILSDTHMEVIAGWRVMVQHDIGNPQRFRKRMDRADSADVDLPDIVISGHSHKAWWEYVEGIWFVNPGSAGPARFQSRPTCAILELDGSTQPKVQIISLDRL